jgi:hypothetical protein
MKRFLMIVLAAAMVLSAATVFADVKADRSDINLSGMMVMGHVIAKNLDMVGPTQAGDADANPMVVMIKMEAKVDRAKAVIELQTGPAGYDRWGTKGNVGMAMTGAPDFQNGDSADLYFRQAYLAFPIAGINVSIGHQLIALGQKSYFDASKDGAATILLTYPLSKTDVIGIGTIKREDNGVYSPNAFSGPTGNDKNFHFAFADFNLGGHKLGINVSDMQDNAISGANLYNWGLTLSGKLVGTVEYTLAGDIQSGKEDGIHKNQGYHVRGRLASDVGPVKVTLGSSYYSGEKNGDSVKKFITYRDDHYYETLEYYETFVFGYFSRELGGEYSQGAPKSGGFWFNKIGVDRNFTRNFRVRAAYVNIRGTYGANAQYATVESKKVGDEFDFLMAYTIAKNLIWEFESGYLMPSTAYKQANAMRTDDAMVIRNTIKLLF